MQGPSGKVQRLSGPGLGLNHCSMVCSHRALETQDLWEPVPSPVIGGHHRPRGLPRGLDKVCKTLAHSRNPRNHEFYNVTRPCPPLAVRTG